jgi:DNA repair protein RadC
MSLNQNKSIKHWAQDDRPREKLMSKGKASLSDAELIAILLGSGVKNISAIDVAKNILAQANNDINTLGRFNVNELKKQKGVGEARAITIMAALELGLRRRDNSNEEVKIKSSQDAYVLVKHMFQDLQHEEFWIILLSKSSKVLAIKNIGKGGTDSTIVDTKLIFKTALEHLASSIILCHNHPSGNLNAIPSDIGLTKKIKEAAKNLDIEILDHVIFGNLSYYSFADQGIL